MIFPELGWLIDVQGKKAEIFHKTADGFLVRHIGAPAGHQIPIKESDPGIGKQLHNIRQRIIEDDLFTRLEGDK